MLYPTVMRLTIVRDASIEVTGIHEFAERLPAPPSIFVAGSPDVPQDLTPAGSLWIVGGEVGLDARIPAEPLRSWLESPETTPDMPISILVFAAPHSSLPAALLSGYVMQA